MRSSTPLTPPHEPPEPPESPSLYSTPAHSRCATPSPLPRVFKPIKVSKQAIMRTPTPTHVHTHAHAHAQETPTPTPSRTPSFLYPNTRARLLLRNHHRTDPVIWCCAIICLIFSILVILFGLTTLILFLVVKPRTPVFDTNYASLDVINLAPGNYNGNFTFIANFSNPNRKLNVRFEYALLELFFENNMMANQTIRPFSQREKETGTVNIHFISSVVNLPLNNAMELKRQVQSNKVMYSVRGTFRVRASFGLIHFTYWLHGRCELQMSSPPTSVLMARRCITKR